MSSVIAMHSYASCEGVVSLFSAHSFDKLAFCGVSVKGQTQLMFSLHSCSVFLCYCEMDAFYVFSIFYTICRIGSLLSALILMSLLLCVVLVAYILFSCATRGTLYSFELTKILFREVPFA